MSAREFLLQDTKINEAVSNGYDIRLDENEVIEKMELYLKFKLPMVLSRGQTSFQWIRFEDNKPSIGQEIWIVWPSGNYRPELRLWDENMKEQIWDDMRWLPVPNYKP